MNKILLTLLIILSGQVNGQNWQWAKSADGHNSSYDEGSSCATDTAGNVFVTGYFSSPTMTFGSYTLTNAGSSYNVFLAKYDANGNVLWAKSAGGSGADQGISVCTDAAGNVFLTGGFQSPTITFGTYTLTNTSIGNMFLVKYNSNGNVLWAKCTGGSGNGCGFFVSTDATGNVFVVGDFGSPSVTFDSYSINSVGSYDAFIAKYDGNGNALWAKSAGGTSFDWAGSVSCDAVGNVFVTGTFQSPTIAFDNDTLTNAGSFNIFISKYDVNGNVLWAKSAGGTGDNEGACVDTDVAGNVFLTGYYHSPTITFGTHTLTNLNTSGGANAFLTKYDANGNALWANQIGGAGDDKGYYLSTNYKGDVFVTGGFTNSSMTFGTYTLTTPAVSTDPMFIAKYNNGGNILCASALASGGDDQCGVSADRFGNAYIGGDFMINPFVIGSDTLIRTGAENVFVAKWLANCNNIDVEQMINDNEFNIYPNPARETFLFETHSLEKQTLNLYDLNGKLILSRVIFGTTTFDIKDLPVGVYTIVIKSTTSFTHNKLIILH